MASRAERGLPPWYRRNDWGSIALWVVLIAAAVTWGVGRHLERTYAREGPCVDRLITEGACPHPDHTLNLRGRGNGEDGFTGACLCWKGADDGE